MTLVLYGHLWAIQPVSQYSRIGVSMTRLPRLDIRLQEEDDENSPGLISLPITLPAMYLTTLADMLARDMLLSYCLPADNQPRRYACD